MTYNKVRTWLYKEGQEFEAVTGGWTGRQLYTVYGDNPQNTGTFIKHDTYLEYGSPVGDSSVGCFLTTNKIDLTKYSTLVVDREIVDWNGYYVSGSSGWNGHAFDTVYIFDTPTPQVVYGNTTKPTSLHNLDLIGSKPEGVYPKRETLNLDVASRTTSYYIGVAGEASGSSATFINCNLYNMYLETNVTAITHTVDGKTINIQANNADGLVTYSKVDIIVGGKVIKTFTGAELSSTMSYTLTSANTLHNVVSIRAAYSQGGGPEDIVGVDFDIVDESVQGMPFRNGIDENTVFCLRGDCYSDISFAPKQVTNHGTSIIDDNSLFGKAIYFSADTTNNKITSTDGFAIDPSSDITFEWWEYSLDSISSSTAALFTNRITPNDYWARCIMFGYKGIRLAVGDTKTTWDISTVDHKDRVNNEWVHWALVKQGNVYITYRNGVTFSMHSAAASFGKTEGDALTIGAWIRKTEDDSSCGYNAYISDFKISNVARYSKEFTPDRRPSTSVNITDLVNNDGVLSCSIYQGSAMDTISKVDITVNGNVVESKTNNFYNISYEIDDTLFKVGSNKIEVRAYYFNNCYVSRSYIVTKPLVLEEFEPLTKLDADAGLGAIKTRISEINNAYKISTNNLKNILEFKGVNISSAKLSNLIVNIKQLLLDNDDSAEAIDTLKELLRNEGIEVSDDEELMNLITKIDDAFDTNKNKLYDLMLNGGHEVDSSMSMDDLLEKLSEVGISVTGIEQIAANGYVSYILEKSGQLWSCGNNQYGQLGLGSTSSYFTMFKPIPNMNNVKHISCGSNIAFAVKKDGSLWACGSNAEGILGLGDTANKTSFTQVTTNINNDVEKVACGDGHTLILKTDGTVWSCGSNYNGQLGLGDNTNKTSFTQVPNMTNVKKIECCVNSTFILKNDGTLWACGYNYYGQLGLNNNYNQNTFTQVTTNVSNDVKDISCGGYMSLLVKNNGTLWVTGQDSYGGFGWNNTGFQYSYFSQTTNNINSDVEKVACGSFHSVILKTDGSVWGSGYNSYGQLGLGNTSNYKKFTQATFGIYNDVVDIICGETHTMVIKKDGTVLACGQNHKGQVGTNGASTYSFAVVGKLNE